jgi:ribose transport system substrate-binding protein
MAKRSQRRLATAAVAGLALALSACSSASSGGSTPTTSGGANGSTGSPSVGVVAQMQKLIEANSAQPVFKAPGPPLDASKLSGKTIAIVAIDLRVPELAQVADFVKAVCKPLGIKTTVFDAASAPSAMQQGMQQAINNGAGAIISDGLVPQLISNQIKAAKAKGIPTVDVINTPPVPGVPGQGSDKNMFGNVAPNARLNGELMAAAAIVATNGHAQVGIMNTSELTVSKVETAGMKSALSKCSSCSVVNESDTSLNDWSTALPGLAATTIRSHPNINFLLTLYDAMGIFATSGVQQANATGKVRIASFDGTAAALALIQKGKIFYADTAEDPEWAAYAAVDQSMRGMLKMAPANPVLPVRYTSPSNLQGVDTSSPDAVDAALFGTGYKTGYQSLWGTS